MNDTPDQPEEQPKTPEQQCEELLMEWGLGAQCAEVADELPPMPDVRAKRSLFQSLLQSLLNRKSAAPVVAKAPKAEAPAAPKSVVATPKAEVPAAPKPVAATPKAEVPASQPVPQSSKFAGLFQRFDLQNTWVKVASGAVAASIVLLVVLVPMVGSSKSISSPDSAGPIAKSDSTIALEKQLAAQAKSVEELNAKIAIRDKDLDAESRKVDLLQGNLDATKKRLVEATQTLKRTGETLETLRKDSREDRLALATKQREFDESIRQRDMLKTQIEQLKKVGDTMVAAMKTPEGTQPVMNIDEVVESKLAQATKELNAKIAVLTKAHDALDTKTKTQEMQMLAMASALQESNAELETAEKELQVAKAATTTADLEKTIAEWKTKLAAAEKSKATTAAEKQALETQLAQSKSFRTELETEINAMAADKTKADTREKALALTTARQKTTITDLGNACSELMDKIERMEAAKPAVNATPEEIKALEAKYAALTTDLSTKTASLTTAQANLKETQSALASSKAARVAQLHRMTLFYLGPPRAGQSRIVLLQQAITRNSLAARATSLKRELNLQQAKEVVAKVDALLTQLTLLDESDLRSVTRFRDSLAKSDINEQVVEVASAKTSTPALVAYLTEAQLILTAAATA
ncbi:MAG: hypothetical protein HN370_06075 [Phycisphaerales bacterium]|nr:hypothetical protein [Phycisphaerales bacterium]